MADIAYNVDLNHEEKILVALTNKLEGKKFSYVCNDEELKIYLIKFHYYFPWILINK